MNTGEANRARFDEICSALHYPRSHVASSLESIHSVRAPLKSTSVQLQVEVLLPRSFQNNHADEVSSQSASKRRRQPPATVDRSTDWRNTIVASQEAALCVPSEDLWANGTSNSLLLLLYSLGCFRVQERVLLYGLSPQKRWNDKGLVDKITPLGAGLNQHFVRLLSTRTELEQAIQFCIGHNMIVLSKLQDGSQAYSLTDQSRTQISGSPKQSELALHQGLIFTSHIYPREEHLHDS